MSSIHQLVAILLRLWRRKQAEAELDAEVQSYFEVAVAREMDRGLTREDAQRQVRLRFDGPEQVKHKVRHSRAGAPIEVLLQDLAYAWRSLRRSPAYAITAICTLALGIGANTVMFSVISGVILRPLPFCDPGRLVQLNESDARNGAGPVSYADLQDWRDNNSSFESMIAYGKTSRDLQSQGEPERILSVWAERGLFRMLGTTPLLGRTFHPDDPLHVVVLSADLWRRHFARDASCIGQKLILGNEAYTVIGVMPDEFQFPYGSRPQLWIPWEVPPQYAYDRNYHVDFAVARVKSGIRLGTANNELNIIAKRLARNFRESNKDRRALLTPLSEVVTGRIRPVLLTLLGVVGMVLLIACANVGNLLLARMARRTHEIAVRAALGASKWRLIQQMLTESLLVSALGGFAGFLVALSSTGLLRGLASAHIPRASEIGLDWRVFCFSGLVSFGVGIVFGLAPALTVSQLDVQPIIKKDYENATYGANRRYRWSAGNLRDALIVAEIAMAFVLLAGSGLLLQTFLRLQATPSGLNTDRVLTLHLGVALRNYAERGSYDRYLQRLEGRLNVLPGVRGVGFIQFLPLQNWGWMGGFSIVGKPTDQEPRAELRYVTPSYFRAFGIPVRKGRTFSNRDSSDSTPVILINDALAKRYFSNEDPIGKRTDRGTIIGIVGDVRQSGLGRPVSPEIYYPFAQNAAARSDEGVSLIVNTVGPPETMASAVRMAIHQVNPSQAMFDVRTMKTVVSESLADLDLYLWLVALFAGLALIMATAGIYGVVSYAVETRIREFAIRLALGADRGTLLKLVLGHGGRLIVNGLILGSAGAFGLQHVLKRFVVGVPDLTVVIFCQVSVLLACVALTACFGPAARATRVDPNVNLRGE